MSESILSIIHIDSVDASQKKTESVNERKGWLIALERFSRFSLSFARDQRFVLVLENLSLSWSYFWSLLQQLPQRKGLVWRRHESNCWEEKQITKGKEREKDYVPAVVYTSLISISSLGPWARKQSKNRIQRIRPNEWWRWKERESNQWRDTTILFK